MSDSTFLTRVELFNYKSITHCSVELRPLMFLVGPNGAGKSNFLEALDSVAYALTNGLGYVIQRRGGINAMKRSGSSPVQPLIIRLWFNLPGGGTGTYFIRITTTASGNFASLTEGCRLYSDRFAGGEAYFYVDEGRLETSEAVAPAASRERLYLVAASGLSTFRPVYDALSRMAFYNFNPALIKDLQIPEPLELLAPSGFNLASILRRMGEQSPEAKRRLLEHLAAIVPGIADVEVKNLSQYETLEFTQRFGDDSFGRSFPASSMSDGTLRALAVLVALYQGWSPEGDSLIPLIGIEEPETGLHPAAVGALLGAMQSASLSRQILVTSHSDDLLDNKNVTADMLLAVASTDGMTQIGPIDAVSRSLLRDRLYTAGELVRQNQISPDQNALTQESADETLLEASAA